MPKGRMLNKKISFDEEIAKLSLKTALFYTWCIPNLDVEGRILADFNYLKGHIVPYRKDFNINTIKKCVEEIGQSPLVLLYGNSYKYMQFLGFTKNQKIIKDREAPSQIPAPTQEELQSKSRVTHAKVNISKVNIRVSANAPPLSDDDFLKTLKTNLVYKHINFDLELGKMDVWLSNHSGRKKTRRFIINWLNKVEQPVNFTSKPVPKPDPACDICAGKGKIPSGAQKGAVCLCVK